MGKIQHLRRTNLWSKITIGDNPWVCVASGPSLIKSDIDQIAGKAKIATAGLSFKLCPYVDLHFAADFPWWEKYHSEFKAMHPNAELWTQGKKAAKTFGLNQARVKAYSPKHRRKGKIFHKYAGWSATPGEVYSGGLSGFMLLQVVGWQNPSLIVLLGYDCQHGPNGERHFDGGDYDNWSNVDNIHTKVEGFNTLAMECPIKIVNCTRESALSFFDRAEIRDIFP